VGFAVHDEETEEEIEGHPCGRGRNAAHRSEYSLGGLCAVVLGYGADFWSSGKSIGRRFRHDFNYDVLLLLAPLRSLPTFPLHDTRNYLAYPMAKKNVNWG
jgi:hypothetical protein